MANKYSFRKPTIYLTLPGDTDISNQLPVQGMTARDDLFLCTPDALMNGQATTNVIESCCPSITSGWNVPYHHLNTILGGIKLATEGDETSLQLRCKDCKEVSDYHVNIHALMQNIRGTAWITPIEINGLAVRLNAPTYRVINDFNIAEFRIMKKLAQIVKIEDPTTQDEWLQAVMEEKSSLQVQRYSSCIRSLQADGTIISRDNGHAALINEFIKNADPDITLAIQKKIDEAFEESKVGSVDLRCSKCKKEYKLQVEFDFCVNFRNQLLASTDEDIVRLLDKMTKQQKEIQNDLIKTIWFMRGSVTYDEAYMLTHNEREQIGKLIQENLEVTKKTGMNFF